MNKYFIHFSVIQKIFHSKLIILKSISLYNLHIIIQIPISPYYFSILFLPVFSAKAKWEHTIFRGVAYYVILPRQGVWGLPEAPSGVQGQSPVGGFVGPSHP